MSGSPRAEASRSGRRTGSALAAELHAVFGVAVPQLSDPDYRTRNRVRESDLRRHLVNEAGIRDDVLQDDNRPDPRFQLTAAQLEAQHIEDYQLHYALQTISRLGRIRTAGAARPVSR